MTRMPAEDEKTEMASGPDFGFLRPDRMPDGGPRYIETPENPYAENAPFPAEPWNTLTASFFIFLVAFWVWRLRGRYRQFPFLVSCLPILLAGGIGGTLYHALRTQRAYFLLDVIPISILGLAGGVYLAVKLWKRRGWLYLGVAVVCYFAFTAFLFLVIRPLPVWERLSVSGGTIAVNANYASLAVVVIIPLFGVLIRTRFRNVGWVVAGLTSFALAWFFRLVDQMMGLYMPMGSHWLWHSFGAAATAFLVEYFYRVEGSAKLGESRAQ